jgi:hypothetical protein
MRRRNSVCTTREREGDLMARILLLVALLACVGCHTSGLGIGDPGVDLGSVSSATGSACSRDNECGVDAYCKDLLDVCAQDCQLAIGTARPGSCHRDCTGGSCRCGDDADCPGLFASCDRAAGRCVSNPAPICHGACPPGCSDETNLQYSEHCVCAQCAT